MIIGRLYILLLLLLFSFKQIPAYSSDTDSGLKPAPVPINYRYNNAFGNYYFQSLQMKEYRWEKFPITVNINKVPNKYKLTAIRSVNAWGMRIPLKLSKSEDSNISIVWTYKLPVLGKGFVGQADHFYKNGIHKCKITVLYKKNYTLLEIQEILIHELGHALGLDHSHNSMDIMYNTIKPYKKVIPNKSLITPRDLNTLYLIYSEKKQK